MERLTTTMLRIGDWCVNPTTGEISRDEVTAKVEVRTMRLLLCLAEHAGEVVSIDDLLNHVWPQVTVAPDSVYQAITSLRRLLGDDPKQPTYIATVPRLGYRMVARVGPWVQLSKQSGQPGQFVQFAQSSTQTSPSPASDSEHPSTAASITVHAPRYGFRRRSGFTGSAFAWVGGATLCVVLLALAVVFLVRGREANGNLGALSAIAPASQTSIESIAVLPFLDLTEGMKQEEFADGMTEELIGRFSKIPGLRVPSPTSSFYFKGKQIPLADMAKTLGVAYVLDGSVRKSGVRLRVAARLIRADNGYVVWSETYDRPLNDILMVQDDIAGEVTKALKASIDARPDHRPTTLR